MIKIIAAVTSNGCIGKDNNLVVKNSDDMDYFKMRTMNSVIVMGMGTWKSIGKKPLENRLNCVVTNLDYSEQKNGSVKYYNYSDSVDFVKSLGSDYKIKTEDFNCANCNSTWIIGGESIYRKFMEDDLVDEIHLTRHDIEIDGDRYFPMDLLSKYRLKYKHYYKSIYVEIYERKNN